MRLKWYGTASVLLEQDGTRLLFDPFFPLNKRLFAPPPEEYASADRIFVTHGHLDHIAHIPRILRRGCGAAIYCTAAPRETLIAKGVPAERICLVAPGTVLRSEPFEVRVLKGRHIAPDKRLVLATLLHPRVLLNLRNARYLAKENKACAEAGETVVYDVSAAGKRVLLPGSLNLDEGTLYPEGADLLLLPFQGRSGMAAYAMPFIERLRPKKIMLIHFDNTFPPVSRDIKTEPFMARMRESHPDIAIIRPKAGMDWLDAD